jgi:hypothetical protein
MEQALCLTSRGYALKLQVLRSWHEYITVLSDSCTPRRKNESLLQGKEDICAPRPASPGAQTNEERWKLTI